MNIKKTSESEINIAISWAELPAYGARLISAGIKRLEQPVTVIATIPQIPITGMEEILGQKIHWIDGSNVNSWEDLHLPVPDIFFQAGWCIPSFNKLGKDVRYNGGKVIALIDNCWKGTWRQWIGALKFRLVYRKGFSAVWVPGESGARLCRFFGMPSSRIYKGIYCADPACFVVGDMLYKRPKQFIFVGQFIPRKGIPVLVKAFELFYQNFPDWRLVVYGAGECKGLLENRPGIDIHPFAQPPQIAEGLKHSRFLILPSLEDHWPLVVLEAATAGCGLIVSDKVGNREDLVNAKNGLVFSALSIKALSEKMQEAASLPDWRLDEAYDESRQLSSLYKPEQWGETFYQIVSQFGDMNADDKI